MDKKENKTNFDLSILSYKELIDLNYKIEEFLEFLKDNKEKITKDLEVGNE